MAIVAFIFCIVFILFFIRKDIKECRKVSHFLWIPFIWLAISASRPFSAWIYPNQAFNKASLDDYLQGNPTERIFLTIMIGLGLAVLYRRRYRFSIYFRENIWLCLIYLYILISIGWSTYAAITSKRWIKAIGNVIMAIIILTEDDHEEAIEHVLRRLAIISIPLSVLFIKYYSFLGVYYDHHGRRFVSGVTTNKNELGLLCAYLGIFLIWRLLKAWPKVEMADAFLLFLILYLLRIARSSTSNVVLVLGTLLLVGMTYLKISFKTLIFASILLFVVLQGLLVSGLDSSITGIFFTATGREPTFTGRIPIWSVVLKIGFQNPILGAGYGNFWLVNMNRLMDIFPFGPTNAHNGYIDTFLDLGIIGLVFLILLIVQTFKKTLNIYIATKSFGKLMLILLVMILFHNFTESHILMPISFLWFLFLLLSISVAKKSAFQDASPDGRSP